MKLSFTTVFTVLLLIPIIWSCNPSNEKPDIYQLEDGHFASAMGGFSAWFPEQPQVISVPNQIGDFKVNNNIFIYSPDSSLRYYVSYLDFPQDSLDALEVQRDLLIGARNVSLVSLGRAKIVEEEDIKYKNYDGISYRALSYFQKNESYIASKIYLVKNRIYNLAIFKVFSPPTEEQVTQFLDSFELLEN